MTVKYIADGNTDGTRIGQSATDKVGCYGNAPIVQRSLAAQATSLLSSSTTFSTAHLNAFIEIMSTLAAVGLWKGDV